MAALYSHSSARITLVCNDRYASYTRSYLQHHLLVCIGVTATFIPSTYFLWQVADNQPNLSWVLTGRWRTIFYSLTLATNLISTGKINWSLYWIIWLDNYLGLLAYRIQSVDRQFYRSENSVMRRSIYPIMLTIVDAGILYSTLLIVAIATWSIKSSGSFFVLNTVNWHLHTMQIIRWRVFRLSLRFQSFSTPSSYALLLLNHQSRPPPSRPLTWQVPKLSTPHATKIGGRHRCKYI